MEIEVTKAGKFNFDAPQQSWHPESDNIMQTAKFAGQDIMAIQKSDDEPDIYELHFLGLMVSGFESIEEAKKHAPQFAKDIFHQLSMMISD